MLLPHIYFPQHWLIAANSSVLPVPFSAENGINNTLSVLTAKVHALLRRSYDFAKQAGTIECGGATLSTADAALFAGDERVELTKNEYRIMLTLLENKGRVVSREKLMNRLWETDSFIDENTLTVNIARLRRKLAAAGLDDYIKTRVGMGYIVEE